MQHTKQHEDLACLDKLILSLCPCTLLPSPQYAFVLLGIDVHRFLLHHTTWQLDALLCIIRWKLTGGLPEACASQPHNKTLAGVEEANSCHLLPLAAAHTSCQWRSMHHSQKPAGGDAVSCSTRAGF